MLAIQYELYHRAGEPLPFAGWFERDDRLRVFAADIRFLGGRGRAQYAAVTTPGGSLEEFCSLPATNCDTWRVVRRDGTSAVVEAAWREPIYPGVHSPMHVATRALGKGTRCAVEITPRRVIHRVLHRGRTSPEGLWPMLLTEMQQYAGLAHVDVACELAHLGKPAFEPRELARSKHMRMAQLLGVEKPEGPAFRAASLLLGMSEEGLAQRLT